MFKTLLTSGLLLACLTYLSQSALAQAKAESPCPAKHCRSVSKQHYCYPC